METSILDTVNGTFDIVVSNPPYIPHGEIAGLDADVRSYDPLIALDGGADGLAIYLEIHKQISVLPDVRYVVLEVGAGQAEDVARLFCQPLSGEAPWAASFRQDLGGHTRCVTLMRQSSRLPSKTVGTTGNKI